MRIAIVWLGFGSALAPGLLLASDGSNEACVTEACERPTIDDAERCLEATVQLVREQDRAIVEVADALLEKARWKRQAIQELASGRYCATCLRTAKEVERQTGRRFGEHEGAERGASVPASASRIRERAAQYDAEMESARRRLAELDSHREALIARIGACDRKRRQALDRIRSAERHARVQDRMPGLMDRLGALRTAWARAEAARHARAEAARLPEHGRSRRTDARRREVYERLVRAFTDVDASLTRAAAELGEAEISPAIASPEASAGALLAIYDRARSVSSPSDRDPPPLAARLRRELGLTTTTPEERLRDAVGAPAATWLRIVALGLGDPAESSWPKARSSRERDSLHDFAEPLVDEKGRPVEGRSPSVEGSHVTRVEAEISIALDVYAEVRDPTALAATLMELGARHPELAIVHFHAAMLLERQERWKDATEELRSLIAKTPESAPISRLARSDLRELARIAAAGPTVVGALIEERRLREALLAVADGRTDLALRWAESAAQAHPAGHRALRFGSIVLEHLREWAGAAELEVRIFERAPSEARVAAERIRALEARRRADVTRRAVEQCRRVGDHRCASRHLFDAWVLQPSDQELVQSAVLEALALRDVSLARRIEAHARSGSTVPADGDPFEGDLDRPSSRTSAGHRELEAGRPREAFALVERMLETDDDPCALIVASRAASAQGWTATARSLAERAAAAHPWSATAARALVEAARMEGDSTAFARASRRAERLEAWSALAVPRPRFAPAGC